MSNEDVTRYLPLSESTYYILLALIEPLHGYGVMQRVEAMTAGQVKIGPGTLYGAFAALEKERLVVKVKEEERRKSYVLTAKGRRVLSGQIERSRIMARNGEAALARLSAG